MLAKYTQHMKNPLVTVSLKCPTPVSHGLMCLSTIGKLSVSQKRRREYPTSKMPFSFENPSINTACQIVFSDIGRKAINPSKNKCFLGDILIEFHPNGFSAKCTAVLVFVALGKHEKQTLSDRDRLLALLAI
jgi:hypothetical protein